MPRQLAAIAVFSFAASSAAQTTWYVDVHASPPGQGSQAAPYQSLKYAIEQSSTVNGDTLLVLPGVYFERIKFLGKNIHVRSAGGPAVTVLDGESSGSVVRFEQGEAPGARLEGFTIQRGTGFQGAGIRCFGASPVILDCRIHDCNAFTDGGGIYVAFGNPTIESCFLVGNSAPDGGGLYCAHAPRFVLRRTTVTLNAASTGSGILLEHGSDGKIVDSIVWGNLGIPSTKDFEVLQSTPQVSYCDIEGSAGGLGIFDADPLFAALSVSDGSLAPGSRCIDAGDPASPLDPDLTRADLGGFPFFAGCSVTLTYCTAGTSSNGCVATISSSGYPSASAGSGFSISIAHVEGQRPGLVFYGANGKQKVAWGPSSSWLCVKAPTQRTAPQNSGGNLYFCDGALDLDWNAFIAAHPSAIGAPFTTGTHFFSQGWYRDPSSAKTTQLSDALEFVVCP